jgi:hypothetical protein
VADCRNIEPEGGRGSSVHQRTLRRQKKRSAEILSGFQPAEAFARRCTDGRDQCGDLVRVALHVWQLPKTLHAALDLDETFDWPIEGTLDLSVSPPQ